MSNKYVVSYGYGESKEFWDFKPASEFYAKILANNVPGITDITGPGYDPGDEDGMGKDDGLTEDQRDIIEAVNIELAS